MCGFDFSARAGRRVRVGIPACERRRDNSKTRGSLRKGESTTICSAVVPLRIRSAISWLTDWSSSGKNRGCLVAMIKA